MSNKDGSCLWLSSLKQLRYEETEGNIGGNTW